MYALIPFKNNNHSSIHIIYPHCVDSRPPDCSYGSIKLVGGPNEYEGRVEVCDYNQHLGTICNAIFGEEETKVFCRQLGFSDSG